VKVIWSVILLIGVSLSIASVYFFGHALSVHEKGKWLGMSAVCAVLAVAIIAAIVKFDRATPDATLHL
jgi:membrane protein DedA with SNARE-associated domain